MDVGKWLMLVGVNLRAWRKRLVLYLLMLAAALTFLFTVTICYERIIVSVDLNLNEADDMIPYRTFMFVGDVECLKEYPEVERVQMTDQERSEYQITVVDYKSLLKFIQTIDANEEGTVIVNSDRLMELEAILKVRRIIQICFALLFVGTLGTLRVIMSKLFQDRYYEISLYKAVGYNHTQILLLLWAEVSAILILSLAVAFAGGYVICCCIGAKMDWFIAQGVLVCGSKENIVLEMGIVVLLVTLLSFISIWKIKREIWKIDMRAIRN